MPKPFTDSEKEYLRERLIHEAEACLALYGIRRTTVDELVRRVGIPKGTFYLFYESKEALIFDVFLKLNADIQQKLIEQISGMQTMPNAQQLTDIIFGLYRSLDGSFFLKLIETRELKLLMQKAPPEFREMNTLEDESMMDRMVALFPEMDAEKSKLYSAALRAAFLMLLHKEDITTADRFDDTLYLILRGIVLQTFGE